MGIPLRDFHRKDAPSVYPAQRPLDSSQWFSYFDFTSKKEEKELYLLCGVPKGAERSLHGDDCSGGMPILIKVQCIAEVTPEGRYAYYLFSCTVVEIDGVLVAEKERQVCRVERSSPIVAESQIIILREAMEQAKIHGTPIWVNEGYIQGHLRLMRLRRGIQGRRGR